MSQSAPPEREALGTKIEIKNLNSFRAVERAMQFEIERQSDTLNDGGTLVQETRLWDEHREETRSMRSKESAHDYRYFPDPDLLPLVIPDELDRRDPRRVTGTTRSAQATLCSPNMACQSYDAELLTSRKDVADYFRYRGKNSQQSKSAEQLDRRRSISRAEGAQARRPALHPQVGRSPAQQLAEMVRLIDQGKISGKIAKSVFEALLDVAKRRSKSSVKRVWNKCRT